ncbi:hypothetical protein [Catenuloplanes indicus]|uniref:Uncharacterized protein n=1 Tax=Catenuloplanes indicus TaxID=137267 RepID=A0AAE4AU45_9ACTN|nr:hypothetical protein [Catenuloplanes indicus]MDQ0363420.1 hypothetical protein [Catenuloplanes indicus]
MTDALADAAVIIEPYISSDFKRQPRALGAAEDLRNAGLLAGCEPTTRSPLPVEEQAANILGCRLDWPAAVEIAGKLGARGLLREAVAA